MSRKTIIEIVSVLLILLFTYAAISKLVDYSHFSKVLAKSPLLGFAPRTIAALIPASEILISLLLCWQRTRLPALYFSLLLLVAFTVYLIFMLAFSTKIPCSCGGVISMLGWKSHIVFNVVFIIAALAGIEAAREKRLKTVVV